MKGALAALLFLTSPLLPGREPAKLETRGSGYEKDPRFASLHRFIEAELGDAMGRAESALGVRPDKAPVLWVLDASPAKPAASVAEPFELGRTAFEGGTVVVTIPGRKYLRAPDAVIPVLRHEADHAVLAASLGSRERYDAVPRWLREGLALDVANEAASALGENISLELFERRPADSFLRGIVAPGVSHAEAGLAFVMLRSRLGQDGVHALLDRFARSSSLDAPAAVRILEEQLAMSLESFGALALAEARKAVAKLVPADRQKMLRTALELDDRGEKAAAARELEALLEAESNGPLSGTVRYLLARKVLEESPRPDARGKSRAHLEALLASGGSLWRPEALVLLGDCLAAEGKAAQAEVAWREVLDAYGEDSGPASRARAKLEKGSVVK